MHFSSHIFKGWIVWISLLFSTHFETDKRIFLDEIPNFDVDHEFLILGTFPFVEKVSVQVRLEHYLHALHITDQYWYNTSLKSTRSPSHSISIVILVSQRHLNTMQNLCESLEVIACNTIMSIIVCIPHHARDWIECIIFNWNRLIDNDVNFRISVA